MIKWENHLSKLYTNIPDDTLELIWEITKNDNQFERSFTIIETYEELLEQYHVENVEEFIDGYGFESIFSNKPKKHYFLESCDSMGAHYTLIPNNDTMPQKLRDYLDKQVEINVHKKDPEKYIEWLSTPSKDFFNKMHDLFTENMGIDRETMKDMLEWFLDWNQEITTKRCPDCESIEKEAIHGPEEPYQINIIGFKCGNCGKVLE